MKTNAGFTLVEILIVVVILGVLAAIVIPQFTNASTDARTSSLCSNLQKIRLQIELYRMHHGIPPSLSNFAAQMTGTTNITGDTSGTAFGPYLRSLPVEPFTNSSTITAGSSDGWNYDETTHRFWAPCNPDF